MSSDNKAGLSVLVRALKFAAEKHVAQRRKDAERSPYINHPVGLLHLLVEIGDVEDPVALAAAVLHDTIEDTQTTATELEQGFGPEVAGIVGEVTDDKSLPKQERKRLQVEHAAAISSRAKLVKLADKICNLRDVLTQPPANWSLERKQEYFDWSKSVVDRLRGTNPRLEGEFDALYRMRPG